MRSICACALLCVLILPGSVGLGAGPELPASIQRPTDPAFPGPAWSWDMDDYRLQQGAFRRPDVLEVAGWPGEPCAGPAIGPKPCAAELLSLIAEDEVVGRVKRSAPLVRALRRVADKFVVWRDWCVNMGDALVFTGTEVAQGLHGFVQEYGSTTRGPTETLVVAPTASWPHGPCGDWPVRTGIGYPGCKTYWHEVVDGGPWVDVPAAASQPSPVSTSEANPVPATCLDVTEAPGPVEYDPYGDLFRSRFARDEEQFRY